jgi:hypothetical protein
MTPPPAFHLLPGVCADLSQWKRNRPKGNFGRSALWNKKIGRWWMVSSKGKQVINAICIGIPPQHQSITNSPPSRLFVPFSHVRVIALFIFDPSFHLFCWTTNTWHTVLTIAPAWASLTSNEKRSHQRAFRRAVSGEASLYRETMNRLFWSKDASRKWIGSPNSKYYTRRLM